MMAYSSVSGGAIFVPEAVERKTSARSYRDLAREQMAQQNMKPVFGKRKSAKKMGRKAA